MAKKNQNVAPVDETVENQNVAPVDETVAAPADSKHSNIIESETLGHGELQAFGEAIKNTGKNDVAVIGYDNLPEYLQSLGYNVVEPSSADIICSNDPNAAQRVTGYGYFLIGAKPNVRATAPDGFAYHSLVMGFVHVIRKVS